MEKMSRKELAQYAGVTPERIRQHIVEGHLTEELVPGLGHVIDKAQADAFFQSQSADHVFRDRAAKQRNGESAGEEGGAPDAGAKGPADYKAGRMLNFAKAKTAKIKADLAELELKEKRGSLVERSLVQQQAFTLAKLIVQAFTVMPEKLAPELAILTDIDEVRERLQVELAGVIKELNEGFEGLGVRDTAEH